MEQIPQPVEEPEEVEKEEEEAIIEEEPPVETEEEPQPSKEEVVEEAAPLITMEDTTDLLVSCHICYACFNFFSTICITIILFLNNFV